MLIAPQQNGRFRIAGFSKACHAKLYVQRCIRFAMLGSHPVREVPISSYSDLFAQ